MVATQEAIIRKNGHATRRKPLLPHKLIDRLGLPGEVRIPATFENWIDLSLSCEYRVEYLDGHVISIFDTDFKTNQTMGQATLTHEQIVANIIAALHRLFEGNDNLLVLGSNMPVFIEEGIAVVNPDVCIVAEKPIIIPYKHKKKTQNALTNPCVVIEVLSQGTRNYDLIDKKNKYFRNPSIQQVVFIEQYFTEISSYTRESDGKWLFAMHKERADTHIVLGEHLEVSRIYQKIIF